MGAPRWVYRAAQFRKALTERSHGVAAGLLESHLDLRGQALFSRMSVRDQVHCAKTAALLAGRPAANQQLVVAALLHDAGKGRQAIWQRVLYVLVAAISPAWLALLARPSSGVRGALYRSLNHAALGAQLAAEAGISAEICRLIARHHEPSADADLCLLTWADEVA